MVGRDIRTDTQGSCGASQQCRCALSVTRNAKSPTSPERASTIIPACTRALPNLADLYADLGMRTEASSLYARILAIEPRSFEALARPGVSAIARSSIG